MSVAKAGSASELVIQVQIEESRFAALALFALDVFLARANAAFGVAPGGIERRPCGETAARFAARFGEVVMVFGTSGWNITLIYILYKVIHTVDGRLDVYGKLNAGFF